MKIKHFDLIKKQYYYLLQYKFKLNKNLQNININKFFNHNESN